MTKVPEDYQVDSTKITDEERNILGGNIPLKIEIVGNDMYDLTYAAKPPAGQYGLIARWTFTRAQFVADLDGATGDYLECLIQDDLTDLDSFQIKGQGRLFGG